MKSFRKFCFFLYMLLFSLNLAACQSQGSPGSVQLTVDEVQATFIGTPWHGPRGAFLFRSDGTYTYQDFSASEPRGTWTYELQEDGTLKSDYTSYTFFKGPLGYSYYHSRSGRTYNAKPNKTAPFSN